MSVVDALIQVGVLIPYVRFDGKAGLSALTVVEQIVATLVGAGLSPGEAGRTLKLISEIAQAAAREALDAGDGPIDPQAAAVGRTLDSTDEFPLLRTIAAARDTETERGRQFRFDIAVVIDGLQHRIEARRTTPPPRDDRTPGPERQLPQSPTRPYRGETERVPAVGVGSAYRTLHTFAENGYRADYAL